VGDERKKDDCKKDGGGSGRTQTEEETINLCHRANMRKRMIRRDRVQTAKVIIASAGTLQTTQ
jgi:hypothetical protein